MVEKRKREINMHMCTLFKSNALYMYMQYMYMQYTDDVLYTHNKSFVPPTA